MNKPKFAVLGAGNGGLATAADLTIRGFDVNLWEYPDFSDNIKPIQNAGGVDLEVLKGNSLNGGFAKIKLVTTDINKALKDVDVVFVVVPSFAHASFAEMCTPHLQDNQIVIVTPGNFGGALTFQNIFKKKGHAKEVIFAESECLIYACRKKSPTKVWIRGYKRGLRISAVSATDNNRVMELIQQVYPTVLPGKNIIETGLSNPNPFYHPAIMILNAGIVDRLHGDFLFYKEGQTRKVCDVIEALDAERLAIGDAFGTKMRSLYEQDTEWYSYQGATGKNIYETVTNITIYGSSKAPGTFEHRYLTEDIPFGLAVLEELGCKTKIATPITTAIIEIAQVLVGRDLRKDRRTLEELGLANLSVEKIAKFVNTGEI